VSTEVYYTQACKALICNGIGLFRHPPFKENLALFAVVLTGMTEVFAMLEVLVLQVLRGELSYCTIGLVVSYATGIVLYATCTFVLFVCGPERIFPTKGRPELRDPKLAGY